MRISDWSSDVCSFDLLRQLEVRKRVASRALTSNANLEADRAIALGEKARDIVDLMDQLRVSGNVREELAQLPGPVLRPPRPGQAAPPDAEAVEAHSGPPAYRLPVVGKVVTGLGELSESGVRATIGRASCRERVFQYV